MNEQEISRLVRDKCITIECGLVEIDEAARIIAEEMSKGVVWEGKAVVDAYWQRPQLSSTEEGMYYWALDNGSPGSNIEIYLGSDTDEHCANLNNGDDLKITVSKV